MWLVVGLGNPDNNYLKTRHNIGQYMMSLWLEKKWGESNLKHERKLKSLMTTKSIGFQKVCFIFPQTYMNLSGDAVLATMKYYDITVEQVIVLHDETELQPKDNRYKFGGGHKGHNGLRDIIKKAGSANFHRIRLGVGRPPHSSNMSLADYVLSNFSIDEVSPIEDVIKLIESSIDDFPR